MKKTLVLLGSMFISQSVFAWGQVGHRVTGAIAEQYLSIKAKQQIRSLYPNESLAEISTYADEERSNPDEFWQKTAGPWHYVTVPEGKTYQQTEAPEEGDAYTALQAFSKTLRDPQASVEEKRLALHFIVHIVGDLHQPLHAGNGADRGGNDFKLEFFWQDSNLHRVWDSGLIAGQELSYTEWTDWLSRKISAQMAASWNQPDPKVWIAESTAIRDTIYPDSDKISYDYKYQNLPIVKQRLQQAGVRIAAYLNRIYE